jgi:hypothetical protein
MAAISAGDDERGFGEAAFKLLGPACIRGRPINDLAETTHLIGSEVLAGAITGAKF